MTGQAMDNVADELLEEAALRLLAARSNGSAGERALAEWTAADPAHLQAARRVMRAWGDVDDLIGDPRLLNMRQAALSLSRTSANDNQPSAWGFARHRWQMAAACLCVMLVGGVMVLMTGAGRPDATIVSNPGDSVKRYTLADGSVAVLDAGSRLSVTMSADARQVVLDSGRARFAVAHDAERPFHVRANDHDVRAVGTEFTVDIGSPHKVVVNLLQGKVDVSSVTRRKGWPDFLDGKTLSNPIRLVPGQELVAVRNEPPVLRRFERAEVTGWEQGRVVLKLRTLNEAADAVNRHAAIPVRIDASVPRDLTVSGSFDVGDSAGFADNIALIYPQLGIVRGRTIDVVLQPQD